MAIQKFLATKEDQISWFVINCGALMEFALDHPVILDFDKQSATLWDGGKGTISLSNIPLLAKAVSAVLKQAERVVDRRLKVHGGIITQNRALEVAKQASTHEWTAEQADSQTAYTAAFRSLSDGSSKTQEQLMAALLAAYNAASFGHCDGHFESAYAIPDNSWLGIGELVDGEIEEAIRQNMTIVSVEKRLVEIIWKVWAMSLASSLLFIMRSTRRPPAFLRYHWAILWYLILTLLTVLRHLSFVPLSIGLPTSRNLETVEDPNRRHGRLDTTTRDPDSSI